MWDVRQDTHVFSAHHAYPLHSHLQCGILKFFRLGQNRLKAQIQTEVCAGRIWQDAQTIGSYEPKDRPGGTYHGIRSIEELCEGMFVSYL